MDLNLSGKSVFVSGSTQGIGYAIVYRMLMEGANVVINGRTQASVDRAFVKLREDFPDRLIAGIAADFSKKAEVQSLMSRLSGIDILINNVGRYELKSFADIMDEEWTDLLEINVMSGIRLTRHLLPAMLAKNWGRIVFIGSEAGINVPANMIHYGMTKTAMIGLSNGLSKLTKGTGVTVNTVLGGPTFSDGVASVVGSIADSGGQSVETIKKQLIKQVNPTSLLERFIDPHEIASLVSYLASPLASAINGSTYRADGGVTPTI